MEKGLGIKATRFCFLTKIKIQKTFMPPNVPPEWFLYALLGQTFFPLVFIDQIKREVFLLIGV